MSVVILSDNLEDTFLDLVSVSIGEDLITPVAKKYVVNVLCTFSVSPHIDPCSLHLNDLLRKGLACDNSMRSEYLRVAGDLALFSSGIFPDRFETLSKKTAYDIGYFIDLGRTAYDNLNLVLFDELSEKFPSIVEGLNDLSLKIKLTKTNLMSYLKRRKQIEDRTLN